MSESVWSFSTIDGGELLNRLRSTTQPLGIYAKGKICMGVKSGLTDAFLISKDIRDRILRRNKKAQEIIKPFLNGRDIRRYHIELKDNYLIYTYHGINIKEYPAI